MEQALRTDPINGCEMDKRWLLTPKCLSHFKDVFYRKNEHGLTVVPNEINFHFFQNLTV